MSEPLPPKEGEPRPHKEESQNDTLEATESKSQHITGLKLGLVVASVTFVAFLMLLDMSIIVTVRWWLPQNRAQHSQLTPATGNPTYHKRVPLSERCRVVRQCLSSG